MNREEILKLMQEKNWVPLIQKFKDNSVYSAIQEDSILLGIIENSFVAELITGNSFKTDSAYSWYIEEFYILHKSANFKFKLKETEFEKLTEKIVSEYRDSGELNKAYSYAKQFPENGICNQVIQKFEKEQSKIVNHSQSHKISLKHNDEISEIDNTTSIFKSKQEYTFFKAVREVFQSYMVFPNVGMNAVIDFDSIKENLTNKERNYYFMGLLDFVVIDQENNYKPIKFVELDSFEHDKEKQIENDRMKDKIVGLAGHKLFRVRGDDERKITEKEFKSLIREIIKEE